MTDEALSALLEGHLPPEEARALRARIAQDPALAQRLEQLEALASALDQLPEVAPPPGLDARVLAQRPRAAVVHRPVPRWPVALAAGLAAGLLLGQAPGAGPVSTVRIGGSTAEVDGTIALTSEEDPMFKSLATHGAALATGAALTLAVVDGQTALSDASGTRTLEAGESARVVAPGAGDARIERRRAPMVADASPEAQERIAALEAELAQLRFENGLMEGQVRVMQGEPLPWPDSMAGGMDPAHFSDLVTDALPEGFALAEVDCEEYPCIAYLRSEGEPDRETMHAALGDMSAALQSSGSFGEQPGMWVNQAIIDGPEGVTGATAVALFDEGQPSDNAATRTGHRADAQIQDLLQEWSGAPDGLEERALKKLGYLDD